MKYTLITLAVLSSAAFAQTFTTNDVSAWQITDPSGTTAAAIAQTPHPAWNNSLGLGWISTVADGQTGANAGVYDFTLSFTPNSIGSNTFTTTFAADDVVSQIVLNGAPVITPVIAPGSNNFWSPSTYSFTGNTVSGVNTLTYRVGNPKFGPMGFTATVTAVTVPEPSSAALLGLGGLALILRRRK